jgi:hypothetical protein
LHHAAVVTADVVCWCSKSLGDNIPRRPWLRWAGWLVKNEILFGTPTMSSWFGMNLTRAVIAPLPKASFGEMQAHHELSRVAAVPAFPNFLPYDRYAPFMEPCRSTSKSRVLRDAVKPNGSANYNYECFIPVYEAQGKDAVRAMRTYPLDYLRARKAPLLISLRGGEPYPSAKSAFADSIQAVNDVIFLKDFGESQHPQLGLAAVRQHLGAVPHLHRHRAHGRARDPGRHQIRGAAPTRACRPA